MTIQQTYPYRYEMELRNVPRFRVMEYLQEIGGIQDGEFSVQGEGWRAALHEMEPVVITVMSIRRDMLIIEGNDQDVVDNVHGFMRRKTMRGGG
jgi:hypothetical protein